MKESSCMKIGIVGSGAVGTTVALGFRLKGHDVYVNDLKHFKKEKIYNKRFLMDRCNLVFVCVPTPPRLDGSLDTAYVKRAVEELHNVRRHKGDNPIIVIKSTVVPGTTLRLANKFPTLKFAFNPEFLRMKHARYDVLHPSRIVIGARSARIANKVAKAYEGWSCPIIITDLNTAEIIKLVANCFLAFKVAYSCEVANLCKVLGLNAKKVMDAVCLDSRIGTSHLDPSKGPIPRDSHCLPKDMSGLIRYLETKGYDSRLLKAAYDVGIEGE
jgi:UDPglucose 6-dehydrogenase